MSDATLAQGIPKRMITPVLADAGAEDERIDAAEHGGERTDLLCAPVDEIIDRQARLA
jgi:hypothetical protein